jgi:hypothetical protein
MNEKFFFHREGGELKKLNLNEVVFFESNKNYVSFLTPSRVILIRITFENAVELLAPYNFVKVNRTKAISLRYLITVNNEQVVIKFQPINNLYKTILRNLNKQLELELSKLDILDPTEEQPEFPSPEALEKIARDLELSISLSKTCYKPLLEKLTIIGNFTKDGMEVIESPDNGKEK